jgi:hemoglobin
LSGSVNFAYEAWLSDEYHIKEISQHYLCGIKTMKQDIHSFDDIKLFVDTFYSNVRKDSLIGPVFEEKIGENWGPHLDTMYRFWQTVLLGGEQTYFGSPFLKHLPLPIEQEHFDRWLEIFDQTLNQLFEGEKTNEAKWRAARMAEMFMSKLNFARNNKGKFIQ